MEEYYITIFMPSNKELNKKNGSLFKVKVEDTRKNKEKYLEDLWRELIKIRADYKCEYPYCHKTVGCLLKLKKLMRN